MLYTLLIVGSLFCAAQAIRVNPLLPTAIWLAGASAFTAVTLYALGGPETAVIELSVGAGLVTVLIVFAISLVSRDGVEPQPLVPKWLAWMLLGCVLVALTGLTLPALEIRSPQNELSFAAILWDERQLDALLQVVLIFSGALSVLGLLANTRNAGIETRWLTPKQSLRSPTPAPAHLESHTSRSASQEPESREVIR